LTDLNALGEGLPTDQDDYFHGWTTYQLLGAAYVGEGSTLGSRFISSALKKNLHLPDTAKASRFYDGYGIETGSLWSEFRAFLTAKAIGHDDEVVEGAEAAFRLYRQLFLHLSTPMYQSEA